MARGKRAKLIQTGPQDRSNRREPVAIAATCTIGGGEPEDVLVTDLGRHGCRIQTGAVGVTKSDALEIALPGCEPIAGSLRWIKGGALGVRFAGPITAETLETLCAEQSAPNVAVLRG